MNALSKDNVPLAAATGQQVSPRPLDHWDTSFDERLCHHLLVHGSDILAIVDADLRRRYVSPTCQAVLGYRPDDLVGGIVSSLDHPADVERTHRFFAALSARPGAVDRLDVRVQHQDGTIRWLELVAANRLADPDVAGFVVGARDITGTEQPENVPQWEEARFRALIQHTSDIITILDANGVVRYESPALERVLGYRPDELVGTDQFALVHPDDVDQTRRLFDEVVGQSGGSRSARFRFLHKDGTWRWLEVIGNNLLADPHVRGVVANSRDVTDRQRVEDDLRERERRHRELSAEARRQAQELMLLGEVRSALAQELQLTDLFRTVVEAVARTFGYTLVSLYLLEGDVAVLQHQVGYERQINRIPLMTGVLGRVVVTGQPVLLEDVLADPDFLGAIEGIVSEVCVPLRDQNRVVGAINVESTGGVRLSDADLRLMVALSEHINVAIGRARLYAEARQRESRFRALVQHADLVGIVEADGVVRYLSPAVESILGYAPAELTGSAEVVLSLAEHRDLLTTAFDAALQQPGSQPPFECRMRHKDGSWRWLEIRYSNLLVDPSVDGIVINARDITERKELEERLRYQARHDPLTGLPNRAFFLDSLAEALNRTQEKGDVARIPVLFMDLDGFKVVNDSLGHAAGDRLLTAVARRLVSSLCPDAFLARFGGDEFAVMLPPSPDAQAAVGVAQRLAKAIAPPFILDGQDAVVSASIGVAVSSPDLVGASDLLRAADVALYRAKAAEKGGVAVFDANRDESALLRLDRETELRRALERGELWVAYQPILQLATGAVVGVEALVRWQHPERGVVGPEQFIPLAEETGLILPLGRWLRWQACHQMRAWQERFDGQACLQLSVNLSPREFQQPDLVADLTGILEETGLSPSCLTLEVTESAAIATDPELSVSALSVLRKLGLRLALDDFGTGYASLSAIKRFPVDDLKIDHSFVAGLGRSHEDTAIVRATIGVARALGLRVTAEGVETAEQIAQLRDLDCDCVQGYFVAPPLTAEALEAFVQARQGLGNG